MTVPDAFPWRNWRHFHAEVIVPIVMETEEADAAMAKLKDTDPYFIAAAFFFAARQGDKQRTDGQRLIEIAEKYAPGAKFSEAMNEFRETFGMEPLHHEGED